MELSIKQMPEGDRPRERLLRVGATQLTDVELVALIFGGDVAAAAQAVAKVGGAQAMRRATVGELRDVPGLGMARSCQLLAALELGARSQAGGELHDRTDPLRTPPQVRERFRDLERIETEELHAIALDARHRVITRFCAAKGAQNVVHVSPRDLFRRLLRENAVGTVIAHNHPSGDPVPSEDDLELTTRLRAAGELVGVTLIDHLVIARGGYYSCAAQRLFRDPPPAEGQPP